MTEKISLLYINMPNERPKQDLASKEAIYNLNIDRMAEYACKNRKYTESFLSVLSRKHPSLEDITYRSKILIDFLKNRDLLESLIQIFKTYDNLRSETEEMTKEIFRYGMPQTNSGLLDCAYEELYINAHFARNVIAYFSELYDNMENREFESIGLKKIRELCISLKDSKCIDEVEKAAQLFRSENAESYKYSLNIKLNEKMEAISASIADILDASSKEKKSIKNIIDNIKKKNLPPNEVDIGSSAAETSCLLLAKAMKSLSTLFSDIANGLFLIFYGIGEELQFYYVACEIAEKAQKAGMKICIPEICEENEDVLEAYNVWDMLLLNEGKDSKTIVPNSFEDSKNGIIALGDNNCGKTSFLRSVGSCVFFAQNGLFVCADKAKVSLRNRIFTHFSSAEKDFDLSNTVYDAAGRFEGEVRDIAKIIDQIEPYSLVLLNESFQTTAYSEGAIGMKNILEVLSKINVRYIFVTHIRSITSLFEENKPTVLVAEQYHLKKI